VRGGRNRGHRLGGLGCQAGPDEWSESGIERPSSVAAVDETFKKAPESKKKHGHQKEFGL
jgi:hypothetical protein